jgi:hypothetical protein
MFCLEVPTLDAAIQLAGSIENKKFPKGIWSYSRNLLEERFIFPDSNYKDGTLNLLFPILNYIFGIWKWGMAKSMVLYHVLQIPFRVMNFSGYIFTTVKCKYLSWNHYFLKSNSYYQGRVLYVQYGFIFYLIRHKFFRFLPVFGLHFSKNVKTINVEYSLLR